MRLSGMLKRAAASFVVRLVLTSAENWAVVAAKGSPAGSVFKRTPPLMSTPRSAAVNSLDSSP